MTRRMSPLDRAAAWFVTGPLGHLWSLVADVVTLWGAYGLRRLRERARQRLGR